MKIKEYALIKDVPALESHWRKWHGSGSSPITRYLPTLELTVFPGDFQ
jgi:hypothetical protein